MFAVAGVAKLRDLAGSRQAVIGFGVPERLAGVVGVLVPAAELLVAGALVPTGSAPFGALGAAVLLIGFAAGIAVAMIRGVAPDCHCFGQLHSEPAGWRALVRNLVLLGLTGFVAIGGWRSPGVSATQWLVDAEPAVLVAAGAGIVISALIAFVVWFCLQLLQQNGRTLARLEALEAALTRLGGVDGQPVALGAGVARDGLPVGSAALEFSAPAADGQPYSLRSLLAGGRPLMLIFSAAGCGPCEALMPELAGWQREHSGRLQIAVLAAGDEEENRRKAAEHGIERVLLQPDRQIADAYQVPGTPSAVVIGADGVIQTPVVGGAEAIRTLVSRATAPGFAIRHAPAPNGHRNGAAPAPPPDASRIGDPAPELELHDLGGEAVALVDLYAKRTVAIFWNPGCGFCQRMLAGLKALEDDPPVGAPELVVISTGEADAVRGQQIRSRVLLDPRGEAMRAFDAGGTPMGVLVEERKIASPVAAGADAVFELIQAAASRDHDRTGA